MSSFDPLAFSVSVFDFDGTIVDSMPSWGMADYSILRDAGIPYDEAFMHEIIPYSERECAIAFQKKGVSLTIDEIIGRKHSFMERAYAEEIGLKEGVLTYLESLHRRMPLVICSNTPSALIRKSLDRFGMQSLFSDVISMGEHGLSKSDPASFLSLSSKLGAEPDMIAFYDDNLPALRNARTAGLCTIGVYDAYSGEYQEEIRKTAAWYVQDWPSFMKNIHF